MFTGKYIKMWANFMGYRDIIVSDIELVDNVAHQIKVNTLNTFLSARYIYMIPYQIFLLICQTDFLSRT